MFSYEVIRVRHKDGDNSQIIRYEVKKLDSGWLEPKISEMDRMDMIIRLSAGVKFGVRESPHDKTLIEIKVIYVGGKPYIKTQANNISEDNLGNLPEF